MLKKYDGMFIFAGSLKDEALDKTLERVTSEIERLGGSVEATENLGRHTFARPMQKRENGVYVKAQFQLKPLQIKALKARLRLSEDVFRFQVLIRDERLEAAKAADQVRRASYRASADAAAARATVAAAANDDDDDDDDEG